MLDMLGNTAPGTGVQTFNTWVDAILGKVPAAYQTYMNVKNPPKAPPPSAYVPPPTNNSKMLATVAVVAVVGIGAYMLLKKKR